MYDNEVSLILIMCSGARLPCAHQCNVTGRDLKFQYIVDVNENFTRISPTDFENFLTEVGPKISTMETRSLPLEIHIQAGSICLEYRNNQMDRFSHTFLQHLSKN
ncbi:hypothetical protein PR048_021736 [Dryococelus australis]|uniref:Uncharacterized protein n=1 Tax=Dryococelus australis TaxID=614101 RepID=A0ABQ9GZ53_9NEOP|nr:hypothetical protein PR048_021736 [Dryococelus australis]